MVEATLTEVAILKDRARTEETTGAEARTGRVRAEGRGQGGTRRGRSSEVRVVY